MKKLLMIAAALAALTSVALAGGGHGKKGAHKARMLQKYDANGDGQLDATEKQQLKADRQARRAAMLQKYDANGDGQLDATERQQKREDRAAARFQKLDANGDGVLSKAEFTAGAKGPRGKRTKL